MEVLLKRTSGLIEFRPHENANFKKFISTHTVAARYGTFKDYDKAQKRPFLSQGENHRINKDGFIERDFKHENEGWFLEINSLEELINIIKFFEEEVIINCNTFKNENIIILEIYDEYRE